MWYKCRIHGLEIFLLFKTFSYRRKSEIACSNPALALFQISNFKKENVSSLFTHKDSIMLGASVTER